MEWLDRSRRYSPLNRAPGLRRVPDEPVGLAFIASLTLHAVLAVSLVHLTDAPQQRPVADVSTILADLAAGGSVSPANPDPASTSAPADEHPAAQGPTMTRAKPIRPVERTDAPTREAHVPPAANPAVPTQAPMEASVRAPAAPSPVDPGEPAIPALDGPTLLSSVSGSIEPSAHAVSAASDIDTPLDAGWPEPPPAALASPSTIRPARTLTAVPLLRGLGPGLPEPAPLTRLAGEPISAGDGLPPIPAPGPEAERPRAESAKPIEPAPAVSRMPTPTAAEAAITPDGEKLPARPVIAQRERRPGTLLGLNRNHALVRLDGPRTEVTDQPTRTVSGTVLGRVPDRLAIYVNGIRTDVPPAGRTFETAVLLQPGANELRAVATGPDGREAEDTVTVQYVPRPSSGGIALTSPPDGLTLGPDDPPIAVVEGELDDKAPTTVWIVANGRRMPVTTSAGRFRQVIVLSDPLVHLWAETSGGDAARRSGSVTIQTAGTRPPSGVLVMQWPAGIDGSAVEVSATWRAHPERLDTLVQTMRLPPVGGVADGAPSEMFYLRGLKSGVYTLIVRYRGDAVLGDVRPTLYVPDNGYMAPRTLAPVSLSGGARRVLAKLLMPEGILWTQDDWFSGRSDSVDTVTKFRVPEGITWVERKADLP